MDAKRFDDIARLMGTGVSRRLALKGIAAGGLVALFGRQAGSALAAEGDACTLDADCGIGFVCSGAGLCVVPCVDLNDCGDHQTCNANNFCEDVECVLDAECTGANELCISNVCTCTFETCLDVCCDEGLVCNPVHGCVECNDLNDCAYHQTCDANNQCVDVECVLDSECTGENELCIDNVCACANEVCGEVCCDEGLVCNEVHGCVECNDLTDCGDHQTCNNDYQCVDVACILDAECTVANEKCIDNVCTCPTVTCGDACCAEGLICFEGACVTPECKVDADCPGHEICVDQMCAPQCVSDADCAEGYHCSKHHQICVANPVDETETTTTLPATGAGTDGGNGTSSWMGAAAIGGTAAYLISRKLRDDKTQTEVI